MNNYLLYIDRNWLEDVVCMFSVLMRIKIEINADKRKGGWRQGGLSLEARPAPRLPLTYSCVFSRSSLIGYRRITASMLLLVGAVLKHTAPISDSGLWVLIAGVLGLARGL